MQSQINHEYIFKPSDLNKYYLDSDICIQDVEFVSVLTRIQFRPLSSCLFIFQNFEYGKQDEYPYMAKIKCESLDTSSLTKMVLTLLFHQLNLDVENINDDAGFDLDDIHKKKLCLVKCKGKFVSHNGKGAIMLQYISGIDWNTIYDSGSSLNQNEKKTIGIIMGNLIEMDTNKESNFNFSSLLNFDIIRGYVNQKKKYLTEQANKFNPIFSLNRIMPSNESQDDFNSQRLDSLIDTDNVPLRFPLLNFGSQLMSIGNSDLNETEESNNSADLSTEIRENYQHVQCETENSSHNDIHNIHEDSNIIENDNNILRISQMMNYYSHRQRNLTHQKETNSTEIIKRLSDFRDEYLNKDFDLHKRKCSKQDIEYTHQTELLSLMEVNLDDIIKLEGFIVGFIPTVMDSISNYEINYLNIFVQTKNLITSGKYINAHTDSIEIMAKLELLLSKVYGKSVDVTQDALQIFHQQLLNKSAILHVRKEKVQLKDSFYTFFWNLDDIEVLQTPIHKEINIHTDLKTLATSDNDIASVDPLLKVCDIRIDNPNEIKYIQIIALLVSAKVDSMHQKYYPLLFTDFTENNLCEGNLDPFIIEYSTRLKKTECLFAKVFSEQFYYFNNVSIRLFGHSLQECLNGKNYNLTQYAMVFKMTLKCKLYKDNLECIIKSASPVFSDTVLNSRERENVIRIYNGYYNRCQKYNFQYFWRKASYFIPLISTENGYRLLIRREASLNHSNHYNENSPSDQPDEVNLKHIPSLLTDIGHFKVSKNIDVPDLNKVENFHKEELYLLTGKMIQTIIEDNRIVIFITSDIVSNGLLDPSRILMIQIIGEENLHHFTNGYDEETLQTIFDSLNFQMFKFKLLRGSLPISNNKSLLIWCPVACNISNLVEQLRINNQQNSNIKLENEENFKMVILD